MLFPFIFLCNYTNLVNGGNNKLTVTDIDGNVYNTIRVGNQVWTIENLRVTHYNDGSPISKIPDKDTWEKHGNNSLGAYCYYNNNSAANAEKYGVLYNWYAVNTDKLAPKGWHIPSIDELNEFINYNLLVQKEHQLYQHILLQLLPCLRHLPGNTI